MEQHLREEKSQAGWRFRTNKKRTHSADPERVSASRIREEETGATEAAWMSAKLTSFSLTSHNLTSNRLCFLLFELLLTGLITLIISQFSEKKMII